MGAKANLTGEKFGKLTVASEAGRRRGCVLWNCICECGGLTLVRTARLRNGSTRSCGCTRGNPSHEHTSPSKGGKSPTYSSWQNMRARCLNPSNPAFAHYKRCGITLCDRWLSFDNFLADMGERPSLDHTLDRINNNGPYAPENVRWATRREQANNRVTNIRFSYKGETYTLAQLARITGVSKEILRARLCRSKLPWSVEGAVATPKLTRSQAGFYC